MYSPGRYPVAILDWRPACLAIIVNAVAKSIALPGQSAYRVRLSHRQGSSSNIELTRAPVAQCTHQNLNGQPSTLLMGKTQHIYEGQFRVNPQIEFGNWCENSLKRLTRC